MTMLDNLLN